MLEELIHADYDFVSKIMGNPIDHEKICGNAFSFPLQESQYLNYFVNNAGDENERLCFKYSHGGKYLGIVSFTRIDKNNDYGHIGIVAVDSSARGKGYGESMITEMLHKGFEELGFNRIDLVVIESNKSGYRFYTEKMGFKDEGLIRDIIRVNNSYLSWYSLSMLKNEWANK